MPNRTKKSFINNLLVIESFCQIKFLINFLGRICMFLKEKEINKGILAMSDSSDAHCKKII